MTARPGTRPAMLDPELGGAPLDPFDSALALSGRGLLAQFNAAGVLHAADVHVSQRVSGMTGERSDEVRLAFALAVRAVRLGSVCLDVQHVRDAVATTPELAALPWPQTDPWLRALEQSPLVAVGRDAGARPGRLVGPLLYLDRYWRQELVVREVLDTADQAPAGVPDGHRLRAALDRLLSGEHEERQRLAAVVALSRRLTVVAGGPGTGKTTTVARLLAVLADQPGPRPRIALAAPTGKAAARLGEAVRAEVARMDLSDRANLQGLTALTVHRLLGWRPGHDGHFRHHRGHPLPYDVVVVDETSMVSLTLMSHLFEALRPQARVVLVGDPDQLASVEAGAVLADVVARAEAAEPPGAGADAAVPQELRPVLAEQLAGTQARQARLALAGVVRLSHRFRFGGLIAELADAIVAGDADTAVQVLQRGESEPGTPVRLLRLADPLPDDDPAASLRTAVGEGLLEPVRRDALEAVRAAHDAAARNDPAGALEALARHQVLCAHRHGPFGAATWSEAVESWARAEIDGYGAGLWYVGRPVLLRVNDSELGLFNGDAGIVVAHPARAAMVAFGSPEQVQLVAAARLGQVETVHALTVHKSQGSQYDTVSLVLPPATSPLLTRELLYTAVTRARHRVQVVGSEASLRAAIARPVTRASGLRGH